MNPAILIKLLEAVLADPAIEQAVRTIVTKALEDLQKHVHGGK